MESKKAENCIVTLIDNSIYTFSTLKTALLFIWDTGTCKVHEFTINGEEMLVGKIFK